MATKSDRPGLLSKMALFVRNPTKDWSELERPQPDQDSGYDKQVLKAMIERKRQNDFIRKREFDQLRKLRSRGVAAVAGLGRPSVFQSSLATDPDGRAVTLKKIDEIEAQMSKQWWKGKQDAATAQAAGGVSVAQVPSSPAPQALSAEPLLPANQTISEQFGLNETSGLPMEAPWSGATDFVATEIGDGMALPPKLPVAKGRKPVATVPAMGALTQSYEGGVPGFSTSRLFAIDVEDMATDPELEEAAIRFANGDDSGAESGLLDALRGAPLSTEVAWSWASALLDLYRATHNRAGFDRAIAEFSGRFETMIPQWYSIGEEPTALVAVEPIPKAPAAHEAVVPDYSADAIWKSPIELTERALEDLREAMASNGTPWHLDWSRLQRITADAMPLLAGLFSSLCNEPVDLRFSGADHLVETLRSMMPSGDQSVMRDWWVMRLNALRTMQLHDEFELAALDYCVTYEISPPPWQKARCTYGNIEDESPTLARVDPSAWGTGFSQLPTTPIGLNGAPPVSLELTGNVLGDATEALAKIDTESNGGGAIVISCKGLVRVDFSAAGSILNWVALREAEGCHVQFRDVQRLVAAFFNVIGINEHARVVPRAT